MAVRARYPMLPGALALRLVRAYGAQVGQVLGTPADFGEEVAPGLYEAELRHLMRQEWARDADDVLWRRSKLGLHYTEGQRARVAEWMRGNARG